VNATSARAESPHLAPPADSIRIAICVLGPLRCGPCTSL
jgi:hypothetical protein